MIQLSIPKLGKRDWHTYMRARFPDAKPRLGAYVLGGEFAGVILRHSHGKIRVIPTVVSPLGILFFLASFGILWAILWHADASEIAGETAERIRDDFGLK